MPAPFRCLTAAMAILLGGCMNLQGPLERVPVNPELEQHLVQRYDPYPEPDVGPRLDGVRPPGFETPISEPARSRWLQRTRWSQPPLY